MAEIDGCSGFLSRDNLHGGARAWNSGENARVSPFYFGGTRSEMDCAPDWANISLTNQEGPETTFWSSTRRIVRRRMPQRIESESVSETEQGGGGSRSKGQVRAFSTTSSATRSRDACGNGCSMEIPALRVFSSWKNRQEERLAIARSWFVHSPGG